MKKYNNDKWDEWIHAALKGDEESYQILLSNLRLWLEVYFSKRVDFSAVEDLVQDTLLAIHTKRHTFDPNYSLGPWVAAVARHRWVDYLRTKKRHFKTHLVDDLESHEINQDTCAKHDIKILLKLIPPTYAKVIELAKLEELSIKEVSKLTGHSVASVRVLVHRGMKKMMVAVSKEPKCV